MNHTITRAIKKVFAFVAMMFLPMVAMGMVIVEKIDYEEQNDRMYEKIDAHSDDEFIRMCTFLQSSECAQFVEEIARWATLSSDEVSQLTGLFKANATFGPVPELSIYGKKESAIMSNMLRDILRKKYSVNDDFSRNVYFFYVIRRVFEILMKDFDLIKYLSFSSNTTIEKLYSLVDTLWNAIKNKPTHATFIEECAVQAYPLAVQQKSIIKNAIGKLYRNLNVIDEFVNEKSSEGRYFKTMMLFYISQACGVTFASKLKTNTPKLETKIISSKGSGSTHIVKAGTSKKSSRCCTCSNIAVGGIGALISVFVLGLVNKDQVSAESSIAHNMTNTTATPMPTVTPTSNPTIEPTATPMPTQQPTPAVLKTYKAVTQCGQRLKNVPERSCNNSRICCYGDGTRHHEETCRRSLNLKKYTQSSHAEPKWFFEIDGTFKRCDSVVNAQDSDMHNNETMVDEQMNNEILKTVPHHRNLICSTDLGDKCGELFLQHSDNVDTSNEIKYALHVLEEKYNNIGKSGHIEKLKQEQKELSNQFLSVEDSAHDKKRLETLYDETTSLSKDIFTATLKRITQIVNAIENSHLSHEEVLQLPIIKKLQQNVTDINSTLQSLNYLSYKDIERIYDSLSGQEAVATVISDKIKSFKLYGRDNDFVYKTVPETKKKYQLHQYYMSDGVQWWKFAYNQGSIDLQPCEKPNNLKTFVTPGNTSPIEREYNKQVLDLFTQKVKNA